MDREISKAIRVYSTLYEVDPDLLQSVFWHESRFNPKAINDHEPNGVNSYGLGQINGTNFSALTNHFKYTVNENNILQIGVNARAAAFLLKTSLNQARGSIPAALSYYSSGKPGYYNDQYVRETMPYYYKLKIKKIAIVAAVGVGGYIAGKFLFEFFKK